MRFVAIIFFLFALTSYSYSQTWYLHFGDSLWSSLSWGTQATTIKLLPQQNKLFVSGGFTRAGNDTSYGIAYWENFHFYPVNSHDCNCEYKDLCIYRNKLVVGGTFRNLQGIDSLNLIATWDGTNWNHFSNNYMGTAAINTISLKGDSLLIGGTITGINSEWYNYVALWNGNNWQQMDHGVGAIMDASRIYCSTVYNNRFIIGGSFQVVAGQPHTAIAEWDGQHWKKMGLGLDGDIFTLWTDTASNLLYASGWFHINGSQYQASNLASWDGQNWHELADTLDGMAYSFCNYRGKIYMGGQFTNVNHIQANRIVRMNGINWDTIASFDGPVMSMTVFNDELIMGGVFGYFNGMYTNSGMVRYYEPPDSACLYFAPAIYTDQDTFYFNNNVAAAQLHSNSLHGSAWLWNFGDTGTDTARLPLHNYTAPGHYTASLTLTEAHCAKTVYKNIVVVDTATGISQQPIAISQQPALRVYPNPASSSVTIEVTTTVGYPSGDALSSSKEARGNIGNELIITDQHGKQIKTIPLKENNFKTNINTKGWAKGTYLCSLVVGDKTVKVEKLVVE